MNNVIGSTRTIILGTLFALNALFFLVDSYYLQDQASMAVREKSSIDRETQTLRSETDQIISRSEELDRKADVFERLIQNGFLNDQNRVTVRDSFNLMAGVTNLIDASYNVSRAEVVESERLNEAGFNLLKSQVEVEISAIDDLKIYNFLYLIAHKYPGLVNIQSAKITKTAEVTADSLRAMNNDNPKPLVSGYIAFDWISVAPLDRNSGG